MRNAQIWLDSFLSHYEQMGAAHFFLADNGSTDGTLESLSKRPDVTLLQCHLQFESNEIDIHRALLGRFGRERWSLLVDQDELFDYPGSKFVNMDTLLSNLNEQGYTAVRATMIDMFSSEPLSRVRSFAGDSLKEKYPFCDLSEVCPIADPNQESNSGGGHALPLMVGGIRGTVFGTKNVYLSKHPLLFDGPSIGYLDGHCVSGARIADFVAMLWHYKFVETFYAHTADFLRRWRSEVNSSSLRAIHSELLAYKNCFEQDPELTLMRPTAIRPSSCDDLVFAGLLPVSERYRSFVASHANQRRHPTPAVAQRRGLLTRQRS